MSTLIQVGPVTLSSGLTSDFKLECDQFIVDNLEGLVHLIRKIVRPYHEVIGVPRGGLLLAEALNKHSNPKYEATLIVDDVFTTGKSITAVRDAYSEKLKKEHPLGYTWNCQGVVVFSRGPCMPWIRPLFQCPKEFFLAKELWS